MTLRCRIEEASVYDRTDLFGLIIYENGQPKTKKAYFPKFKSWWGGWEYFEGRNWSWAAFEDRKMAEEFIAERGYRLEPTPVS